MRTDASNAARAMTEGPACTRRTALGLLALAGLAPHAVLASEDASEASSNASSGEGDVSLELDAAGWSYDADHGVWRQIGLAHCANPAAPAYFTIDADPGILDYFAENAQGVVIAGAGAGSYSSLWGEKINALVEAGFPVVDCSRISNGLVSGTDGGMIEGYNLPPQKSVVLLRLALTVTDDLDAIQEMFKTY